MNSSFQVQVVPSHQMETDSLVGTLILC